MTPSADLSRRERKKLELRARLLEAARDLASERGFGAVRVSDICERADVAQKTFFNYFASKQHLLRELAEYAVQELLVDLETARKEERTTRARLAHFFSQMSERVEQGGPMQRELVTELVHAVHHSPTKSEHARKLHAAFGEIVRDGLAAGEITRRHTPETLTEMMLGAYYVLLFDYANLEDHPIRAHAEAAARFLADALAARPEE